MTAVTTGVKICGVCSADDAHLAESAGATHIGVILAGGRIRSRTVAEAERILDGITALRVGVFVDDDVALIESAARRLHLDVVQLHGDETPAQLESIRTATGAVVWKAVRVRAAEDVDYAARIWAAADGVLLDGWSPHAHGGAGVPFDWDAAAVARRNLAHALRVIVAGGLTPDNVAQVLPLLRPDIVDVSSGVEQEVGRKSAAKVHSFIAAVRGAQDEA